MQPRVKTASPLQDFAFPWTMVDEVAAISKGKVDLSNLGDSAIDEPDPGESLPLAFRAWQLEHRDELISH